MREILEKSQQFTETHTATAETLPRDSHTADAGLKQENAL
jgi:hypothetical protein